MKMKFNKARLQKIIQEEYTFHARKKRLSESRVREIDDPDQFMPSGGDYDDRGEGPGDLLKDQLQDFMMDAAKSYLEDLGVSGKELSHFEYELEDVLVRAMTGMRIPGSPGGSATIDPVSSANFGEDELTEAIAAALEEAGLGDGTKMGGNYSTGSGGSQGESPDQTILPGGKK